MESNPEKWKHPSYFTWELLICHHDVLSIWAFTFSSNKYFLKPKKKKKKDPHSGQGFILGSEGIHSGVQSGDWWDQSCLLKRLFWNQGAWGTGAEGQGDEGQDLGGHKARAEAHDHEDDDD